MIKKIIIFFFALTVSVALVLAFSSCSGTENPSDTSTDTGSQGTTPNPDDSQSNEGGTPDDGNGESPNPDDNQGEEVPYPDDGQGGQEPNPDDNQGGEEIPNPDDNQGDEQGGATPHTHSYGEWVTTKEPTCTEAGEKKQTCSCGDYKTEPIEATGHSEEIVEAVEPNCTETGLTEGKKCSVCGVTTVEQETISAKGHSEETIIGKEATCTETGLTDGKKCTVCQTVTVEQTIIPTRDHNYVDYACTICGTKLKSSEGLSLKLDETTNTYIVTGIGTCKETNIVIPKTYEGLTVTEINDYAFYDCDSLTSVTIGNNVTSIGYYAFAYCDSLASITIGNGVTTIEGEAFSGCSSLKYNEYDNGYYLGNESNPYLVLVKSKDKSITSCAINENTKLIYNGAFHYCTSLTSITIPNSVASIGGSAFYYCSSLTEVHISDISSWCNISFYNNTSNPLSSANNLYINNELVTNLTIPNAVTNINAYAFYNCTSLTSVTIPSSVTSIGDDAFDNCTSLTSVTIGNSVTSIGSNAFNYCYKLVEVYNLSSLNITKGSSNYGYVGCYAKAIHTSLEEKSILENVNDYIFMTWEDNYYLMGYIGNDKELTLPESYNRNNYAIYLYAFNGCNDITKVIIPDSVTSIGSSAFYDCTSLTSVTIGDNVTSIGSYAFENCTSLTSVTIGNGVTYIGEEAFYNCKSLASITIPNSVTSIGEGALRGCSNLESITIPFTGYSRDAEAYEGVFGYIFGYTTVTAEKSNRQEEASTSYVGTQVGNFSGAVWQYSCYNSYHSRYYYDLQSYYYFIPQALKNVTITDGKINSYAFNNCTSITSITISDNVTSIGNNAFYGCTSLTSVTIGNGVTSIGYGAFENCTSLKYNEYDNAYYLGNENNPYLVLVKAKDKSITSCAINENTKIIYHKAFYYCTLLTSITIPSSVTSIGNNAFNSCTNLTEIKFNATAMNDLNNGNYVFSYAGQKGDGIKVTIGKNVTKIPAYLFNSSYSPKITSIEFEEGSVCESIGNYAFYNCDGLTSVTIGNGVTSIGDWAFCDCDSLTSVTIGNSVTSIGIYAFRDCTNLTEIKFNATAMDDLNKDNNVFEDAGKDGNGIKVTIGKNVTKIPAYLFYPYSYSSSYSPKITSVEFEEGSACESIGKYAFYSCDSLTSVTIPNSVTSIGDYAFADCDLLTSVTIPNSVTSIGDYAFAYCDLLTSVTIPNSVTSIENSAFYSCDKLVEVYNLSSLDISSYFDYAKVIHTSLEEESILHTTQDGYVFAVVSDNEIYLVDYIGNETELTLPQGYNGNNYEIYQFAFHSNNKITKITIPNGVTSIGNDAFYNCTSLKEVHISDIASWCNISFYDYFSNPLYYAKNLYINNELVTNLVIPDTVTKINAYAFSGCTSLTSITIPNSVITIGEYAFYNCTSLTSVTIGDSVTSMGNWAFDNCTSLKEVHISDIASWCNISFSWHSSNPLYYAKNLYINNELVTNLVIPNTVTKINDKAFDNCTSLTSITIPNSVTSIGDYAFAYCDLLISVTIPNSVTSIGSYAFFGCYKLVEVYNLSSLDMVLGSKDNGYIGYYAKVIHTSLGEESILETVDEYIFMTWEGKYYLMGYVGNDKELTLSESYNGNNYEIYQYAFYLRDDITSVTIPNSVTSIGYKAFYNCTSLTSVTFENTTGWYVTTKQGATSGTNVDVTNATTNATYLTSQYYNYYWYCNITE